MSPIKESLFLQSIKSGRFSYKRKPDIIRSYSLKEALSKVSKAKLAKEIAFCICTFASERLKTERYYVAFNGIAINNWDEVAVLQLTPELNSFSNLICVNYKIINDTEFRKENELFFDILLHEVKLLRR